MPITVVVTFYSRDGEIERLAHAAAVGAVQKRALIRLRRVPAADREYIPPREGDFVSADALIFGSTSDVDASSPAWAACVELLEQLHADGKLAGKVAGIIGSGPAADSLAALLRRLGIPVTPADPNAGDDTAQAIAVGRAVATAPRET